MDTPEQNEERRILDLVASGQISADEGDALLQALGRSSSSTMRCPWCAEIIPGTAEICPECHESISAPATPPPHTDTLTTLDKILAVLTLFICGIFILQHALPPSRIIGLAIAAVGICSGVFIFQKNPVGWTLGVIWAAVQCVELLIGGHAINRQLFHVGLNFNVNGIGLGINVLAIGFLYFFLKAKKQRELVSL